MVKRVIKFEKKSEVKDAGLVLENFGKFQILQHVLICFPVIFISMMNVNYVFVAAEIGYRCEIPECEDQVPTSFKPLWWPNSTDECRRPVLDRKKYEQQNETCSKDTFTNETQKCTKWVYEVEDCMIAEMNLACESWKPVMVGVMHNVGMLVSMVLVGWLSDRFGRKPCIVICAAGSGVGLIKSFLNSYYWFIAIEFLESAIGAGLYIVAFVILIESAGQKKRVLSGVVFAYGIYMGEAVFACIAMAVPYWRTLLQIVYAPPFLFILYSFILNESPRWQILMGKLTDARKTICTIIKYNNIKVDTKEIMEMNDEEFKNKFSFDPESENKDGFVKIWKSTEMRKRLIVASYTRFAVSFVYYGLLINSVLLPGNRYTNFIISAVMSFPGELMSYFFMSRLGRKYPLVCAFITCGVFCIALAFTPDSLPWLQIVFFVLGKLLMAMCFTGISTYTLELFPTSTRGTAFGICSLFARIGSLLSPLTPLLNFILPQLLSMLFGASVILAGGLLLLTPETKGVPLPDTIEQAEIQMKKK